MRIKKEIQYAKEQKDILEKILDILEINENNKTFLLYDIDNDKEKQEKILALKEDIKKYFVYNNSSIFKKCPTERPYMSIIRTVFKSQNIGYISAKKFIKKDNQTISTQKYGILI